jgi:hypothetical protein
MFPEFSMNDTPDPNQTSPPQLKRTEKIEFLAIHLEQQIQEADFEYELSTIVNYNASTSLFNVTQTKVEYSSTLWNTPE